MRAVPKMLLEIYFLRMMLSYTGFGFIFMFMFNSLFNNIKAETDEVKFKKKYTALHFLLCPSDIYSMVQSLQTGMSNHCGPRSDSP